MEPELGGMKSTVRDDFLTDQDEGMRPALGLVGDNTTYPLEAHVRGLVAHIAFGLVTAAGIHQMFMKDK